MTNDNQEEPVICDMCKDPATQTLRVTFGDDTERVLDLCEAHHDWFKRQSHPPIAG